MAFGGAWAPSEMLSLRSQEALGAATAGASPRLAATAGAAGAPSANGAGALRLAAKTLRCCLGT